MDLAAFFTFDRLWQVFTGCFVGKHIRQAFCTHKQLRERLADPHSRASPMVHLIGMHFTGVPLTNVHFISKGSWSSLQIDCKTSSLNHSAPPKSLTRSLVTSSVGSTHAMNSTCGRQFPSPGIFRVMQTQVLFVIVGKVSFKESMTRFTDIQS